MLKREQPGWEFTNTHLETKKKKKNKGVGVSNKRENWGSLKRQKKNR